MNILAHLYLSGETGDVMLGNYIGDFVKGNKYLQYTAEVQKGILLHRKIDHFTDTHILHKQCRDIFRPQFGLHSGVVTDIIFDHQLANHWSQFHIKPLEDYTAEIYSFLLANFDRLPETLQHFTSIMIKHNWLVMYRSEEGVERVLRGMAKHTSLPDKANEGIEILRRKDKEINRLFFAFMSALKNEVAI